MSSKTLLNESQIRQFMKLARLEPLAQGFVEGLSDTSYLAELRTGKTGALGPRSGRANPGHGRGQGEAADGSLFEQPMDPELGGEEELEVGAEEELPVGGEEELEADVEMAPAAAADEGRMVAVDDFLAALESALEDVMGDEVEIDSDEMAPEEEEEAPDEFAPEGDEVVADLEVGAEEELMETGAEDTGASAGDESETDPGEEDYTTKKGKKKKSTKDAWDRRQAAKPAEKNESVKATDELVEQLTKRVAARILRSALTKK
jgi:hypothetical protein